ncbi:MAG TPA: hypothetical protein VFG11_01635 [Acidobacteriota bacterium]|nr:hypothetical protein [Acidobacteriota bacterium]
MDIKAILGRVFDWAQPSAPDSNTTNQPSPGGISQVPDSIETPTFRNPYFSGKLLTPEDFTQEQDYGLSKSGDYTGNTFDVKQHFSGVEMQQGSVQLDNDSNEPSKSGDSADHVSDVGKQYSGVLMQQGEVQLDNDFNEHYTINEREGRVTFGDGLIGRRLLSDELLEAYLDGAGNAGNTSGSSDDDDSDGKP